MKSGLRRAVRNAAPVPMSEIGPYRILGTAGGGTPDDALLRAYKTNGTVNANVGLLASASAGPVWKMFRKEPKDGRRRYTTADQGSDQRVEVIQHQALTVLNRPNAFWTRYLLFEISGIWMETTGKAHWIVEYDPRASFPVGLWPVRPDRMTPVPDPKEYLKGWIYTSPDGREQVPLTPREVIYNRYPDPEDVYGGAGPIGSVLTDIDAAKYSAEWNRNFFLNSAEPGGVLQVDHTLKDEEYNALVNRWREAHKGVSRAHRIALLEAGVTFVPTGHSMKDMDFGTLRSASRDIIREALGMHKVMTGVTDDVNRANAQTGEEVFASWKIEPRLERWRDVLNSQYLPLFGSTAGDVELDFILPMPRNREQDNLELTAKANAALALVTAGYDQQAVLEVVGLPDMKTVLKLSDQPALPPRWTSPGGGSPPAEPAALPDAQDVLRRQMAAWNALAGER